jgi:hypothetical protein
MEKMKYIVKTLGESETIRPSRSLGEPSQGRKVQNIYKKRKLQRNWNNLHFSSVVHQDISASTVGTDLTLNDETMTCDLILMSNTMICDLMLAPQTMTCELAALGSFSPEKENASEALKKARVYRHFVHSVCENRR